MKFDVLMYEPKVAYRNKRLLYFGCRLVWALLFPQQNIFCTFKPRASPPKKFEEAQFAASAPGAENPSQWRDWRSHFSALITKLKVYC